MIAQALTTDPTFLHQASPSKLEELIAASYVQAGFDEVILTPQSDDKGRDVIAVKRWFVSIRVLDQVKAYKPGRLVDANDVRALLGVLSADRNASNGVVTTTSDFAPRITVDPSIAPFLPYRLELINGLRLAERIKAMADPGPGIP